MIPPTQILHLSNGNPPFVTRRNPTLARPTRRTELPYSSPSSCSSSGAHIDILSVSDVLGDNAIASSSGHCLPILDFAGMDDAVEGIEDVSASQWEEVTRWTPRAPRPRGVKAIRALTVVREECPPLEYDEGQNIVWALEKEAERINEVDEQRRRRARKEDPRQKQLAELRARRGMRGSMSLSRSASPPPTLAQSGPYLASSSSASTRAPLFSDENIRGTPNTIPTSPPSTARKPDIASGLHWSVSPETPRSKARRVLSPTRPSWATVIGSRSSPRKEVAIKPSAPLVIASDTDDDEPLAIRSSPARKGKGKARPTLGDLFIDDDRSSDYDPEADMKKKRNGRKGLADLASESESEDESEEDELDSDAGELVDEDDEYYDAAFDDLDLANVDPDSLDTASGSASGSGQRPRSHEQDDELGEDSYDSLPPFPEFKSAPTPRTSSTARPATQPKSSSAKPRLSSAKKRRRSPSCDIDEPTGPPPRSIGLKLDNPLHLIIDLPLDLQEFYNSHWRRGAERPTELTVMDLGEIADKAARKSAAAGKKRWGPAFRGRGFGRGRGRGWTRGRGRKKH